MKKLIFVIFIILFITGCTIGEDTYEEKYSKYDYDLVVTPDEIRRVYTNNELDGNKKYGLKRIKTTTAFLSVDTSSFLGTSASFDTFYCRSFNSKEDVKNLSSLNRNEVYTIIGTANEWVSTSLNGNLHLEDCIILTK